MATTRTEDDKKVDIQWIKDLLDGADNVQVLCITVYFFQELADRDLGAGISLIDNLVEKVEEKMAAELYVKIAKSLAREN